MRFFLVAILISGSCMLFSQQLYLQPFAARNITKYDVSPFSDRPQGHFSWGVRLAAGIDHLQLGGEYHQNFTDPKWIESDEQGTELGETRFENSFYGVFLRSKVCRYPAKRFGIVLRGGIGLHDSKRITTVPGNSPEASYDQTVGYNGGIDLSFPVAFRVMIELGYAYYHVNFDEIDPLVKLRGSYHSIQAGMSLNLVFGKRAEEYKKIKDFLK